MFCAKHILFLVRSRLFICFKVFLGNGRMPSRSIKTNAKVFISRKAVHLSFVTAVFFTQHHCSYHITRLSFFAQLCVFSMVCFYHHIQKQHRQLDPLTTESRSYSHRDTFLNSNNSSLTLCIGFSFVFIRWQAMSLQACFFFTQRNGGWIGYQPNFTRDSRLGCCKWNNAIQVDQTRMEVLLRMLDLTLPVFESGKNRTMGSSRLRSRFFVA